jgi:hypothetical protein
MPAADIASTIRDTHVADRENTAAGPLPDAWRCGSRTVNSVKLPTSLSTTIVLPCDDLAAY